MFKPLPTSGTLISKVEVADILDKRKGAVAIINVTSADEGGDPVCMNQFTIFLGGAGGFGGKRNSIKAKPLAAPPTRPPDAVVKEKTEVSQAALYRLNGDYNPLHIDPAFAAMGGRSSNVLEATLNGSYKHYLFIYLFSFFPVGRGTLLQVSPITAGPFVQVL